MRTLTSITLLLAVVACQKAPRVEPAPQTASGDFAYRMNVGVTPVSGEFSIVGDTVTFDAAEHGCRVLNLGMSVTARSTTFSCTGPATFQVVVDTRQPSFSRWTSGGPVSRKRQVCDRYTVNAKGEQVCSATRTEVYIDTVVIGGRLQVTPVASANKP